MWSDSAVYRDRQAVCSSVTLRGPLTKWRSIHPRARARCCPRALLFQWQELTVQRSSDITCNFCNEKSSSQTTPKIGHGDDEQLSRTKETWTALDGVVKSTLTSCQASVTLGNASDFASIRLFVASVSTIRGGPPVTRFFVLTKNFSRYCWPGSTTIVCHKNGATGSHSPSNAICKLFSPLTFSETSTASLTLSRRGMSTQRK